MAKGLTRRAASLAHAAVALGIGSLVGGLLTAVGSYAQWLLSPGRMDGLYPSLAIPVFLVSTFVWFAGLTVFAAPPWFVLHKLGMRGWRIAAALGGTLSFLVAYGLPFLASAGAVSGWITSGFPFALSVAVVGVIVGIVVWRVAYARSIAAETTYDAVQGEP